MLTRHSTEDIHDRAARDLVPVIEAAAASIEAERALPATLLEALHRARLFHMFVPQSVGGGQVDPITFFHAIEALASADASTAWCVGQACGVSMGAAYLDPAVAREVFGGPTSVVASGPNSRTAKAVRAPGGYRVTGKWPFASGSRHAQWLGGHCIVCEPDGAPLADVALRDRTMLFPKSAAQIVDVWQVMGLRGTGSDNYGVEDLFVPEAYSFTRDADADRRVVAPLYTHFSGFNMFGLSFAAVSLGVARAMLRDFIRLATEKTPYSSGPGQTLRDNAVIQSKVAQAEAKLQSSRSFVLDVYGQLWNDAQDGRSFTLDDRARMRLASTWAMNQAREVADVAYNSAGGTSIFVTQPFERRFRDINSASQQGQAHQSNFELVGQALLGVTPKGRV